MTVDGTGTTWTNSGYLFTGTSGSGTLNITGGGAVSNDGDGRIGGGSSSTGTVTVDGPGSTWTNGDDLSVGYEGSGVLNITDGGAVSVAGDTWVTRYSGSSGEIHFDGGTLTTGGLFCVPDDLSGTGTIYTRGLVSDFDLVFDATHGPNQTITLDENPDQDVTIDLNVDGSASMGAGYAGTGTMTISDDVDIASTSGHIGYQSGSTGTVAVDGPGSTWTNSFRLYVGHTGNGTLNITGGGAVSSYGGSIGYESGSTGTVTVDGSGSMWTNSASLRVGSYGNGTLNITGGGEVSVTHETWVAIEPGSSGELHFDGGTLTTGGLLCALDDFSGTGTIYTGGLVSDVDLVFDAMHGLNKTFVINENPGQDITVHLNVHGSGAMGAGCAGTSTMSISDGVKVPSTNGYIGFKPGSIGAVTVGGAGSRWTNSYSLEVGTYGSGALSITGGGAVSNSNGYIGYEYDSTGIVTVEGIGSTWINSGLLAVGIYGSGTLNITGGGVVSNTVGDVGRDPGSSGTVTVDGIGSTWINSDDLSVGHLGNGTLSIINGGTVSNSDCIIGGRRATGVVTVDGTGSTWTNNGDLCVGYPDSGTLNITDGGLVSVGGALTIDDYMDGDSFIYMATSGMLALASDEFGDDSLDDFLDLVDGTDAIRYWDTGLTAWTDITNATYGDDYTLEYLTTGNLAGYTVLTVLTPEPGADFDTDGDVDGADFLAWQRGESPLPSSDFDLNAWKESFAALSGDFDADGDTDGADFLAWQRGQSPDPLSPSDLSDWQTYFGFTASSSATTNATNTAVPEPTGMVLWFAGAVVAFLRRNRC